MGYVFYTAAQTARGGICMKEEKKQEQTPVPWELKDPKPPVIRSGHMENRRFSIDN